jgi:SAM-dependent methyltransferase
MKRQLLSHRFARGSAQAVQESLGESQRSMVQAFQRRLASGEYRLVEEPCPCKADDDTVVAEIDRYGLPVTTVICGACACLRTNPFLDDASLDHFYRTTYQTMYARAPQLEPYFARQMAYGERVWALYGQQLSAGAHVLEIGCGAGGGLSAFERRGFRVAGCELDRELVNFGLTKGVENLWEGTIDEMPQRFASQRWDVIFLHHVFEHVQSPRKMLQSLGSLLAPGGRLLTIVPDFTRVDQFPNPAGDVRKFLHVAHKFNYTAITLEVVAAQTGLSGAAVAPPSQLQTPWSEMPELWMEFRRPSEGCAQPFPQSRQGARWLDYLVNTERRFLSGEFEKLSVPPTTASDKSRASAHETSRGPVKRLRNWWRTRRSLRAA